MKGFLQVFSLVAFALLMGSCEADSLEGDLNSEGKALGQANASAKAPVDNNFNGFVGTVLHQYGPDNGGTIHDAYFFSVDELGEVFYIRDRYSSETDYEQLVEGPEPVSNWASLKEAGFDRPNAFMPLQKGNEGLAWVFCGDYCAIISYVYGGENKLVRGPYKITDAWESLREAGFDRVEALFVSKMGGPKDPFEVYVFAGDFYIKISLENGGVGPDVLLQGPRDIKDGWKSLREVGFNVVSAVLPISEDGPTWYSMYVFSENQYVGVKLNLITGEDELITGPKALFTTTKWKNLR